MNKPKVNKRQAQRERSRRANRRQQLITIGIIVLGVSLLLLGVLYPQIKSVGTIVSITPAALPNANGLSLGDANASVTIDVFEDFQCPACQYFTESVEPAII